MNREDYSITKQDLSFSRSILIIFKSVWKQFKGTTVFFALLTISAAILLTIAPKLLQQVIDALLAERAWNKNFLNLIIAYGACLFGGAIGKFASSKISFYIATQIEDTWRYAGLRHYYELPFTWHDQHNSGEVGGKIDRGGSAIYVIIHELLGEQLFVSFITLIFVTSYTFWLFPILGSILLAPIPVYILITYFISQKIAKGQNHLNKLAENSSIALYDGVANVRTVKAFGKENQETTYYAHKWSGYHHFEYKIEKLWFTQDLLQTAIETSMRTFVLAYSVYATLKGTLTIGQIVLIISYQQMTFAPLAQLNNLFTRIRRNSKRVAHFFKILAEEDTLKDPPTAINITPLHNAIKLENVHFEYSSKIAALHDINLTIPAGTTTALVGRSGAGKSTLALLLMRFYDPHQGRILYDSVDLKNVKRASLRQQLAWIPQDTSLFNRSIHENISYGKPNTTVHTTQTHAKLAYAHEFITKTPQGYESTIGERGVRLSGGQRQRIAIARALLIQPSVLIMDESTSHLDSETEKAISDSIKKLHHKTTQIIIAHRLSTILHADQIVVLDNGRIVGIGKHEELLKNNIYKKLYQLQFHRDE